MTKFLSLTVALFLILFILSFAIAIPTTVNNAESETKPSPNNKQDIENIPESWTEDNDDAIDDLDKPEIAHTRY